MIVLVFLKFDGYSTLLISMTLLVIRVLEIAMTVLGISKADSSLNTTGGLVPMRLKIERQCLSKFLNTFLLQGTYQCY